MLGAGCWALCSVLWASDFGIGVLGVRFRVLFFGFWVLGFGFWDWVLSFGLWVLGLELGVLNLDRMVWFRSGPSGLQRKGGRGWGFRV